MAAAFCTARSAAVPTVSRSVAVLLESTGSGWVAVPVAVLASVVPAAPVWTCTVTSTVKLAPDASTPTLQVTTLAAAVHAAWSSET